MTMAQTADADRHPLRAPPALFLVNGAGISRDPDGGSDAPRTGVPRRGLLRHLEHLIVWRLRASHSAAPLVDMPRCIGANSSTIQSDLT